MKFTRQFSSSIRQTTNFGIFFAAFIQLKRKKRKYISLIVGLHWFFFSSLSSHPNEYKHLSFGVNRKWKRGWEVDDDAHQKLTVWINQRWKMFKKESERKEIFFNSRQLTAMMFRIWNKILRTWQEICHGPKKKHQSNPRRLIKAIHDINLKRDCKLETQVDHKALSCQFD